MGAAATFAHRDFRLYMLTRGFSMIATQMQGVAVGWQVYERTHRPLFLACVGLAQFLPAIGLSLLTGHTADRFDRRAILLLCYASLAVCSLLLYLVVGASSVWPIFGVLFLVGVARAFAGPAGQSLVPRLVPEKDFPSAVAWSSSLMQVAMMLGPAIGGWELSATRAGPVYLTCAGAFAVSFVAVYSMRVRTGRSEARATSWDTLLAGVRYVWENKLLLGAISLDLFAVLLGGATALLPIYARDILVVGAWGFGLLRAAPAVGGMLMGVYLAYRPVKRRAGMVMFACVGLFGVATMVFGASTSFWVSIAALVILGASDMVSVYVRQTLVQLTTPDAMRGRVSAVNMVFIGASNELGEFESGVTAEWWGTVRSVVFGGIGTLVVVGAWMGLFPALRKVDALTGRR